MRKLLVGMSKMVLKQTGGHRPWDVVRLKLCQGEILASSLHNNHLRFGGSQP